VGILVAAKPKKTVCVRKVKMETRTTNNINDGYLLQRMDKGIRNLCLGNLISYFFHGRRDWLGKRSKTVFSERNRQLSGIGPILKWKAGQDGTKTPAQHQRFKTNGPTALLDDLRVVDTDYSGDLEMNMCICKTTYEMTSHDGIFYRVLLRTVTDQSANDL
jgi:hypothetical protein